MVSSDAFGRCWRKALLSQGTRSVSHPACLWDDRAIQFVRLSQPLCSALAAVRSDAASACISDHRGCYPKHFP